MPTRLVFESHRNLLHPKLESREGLDGSSLVIGARTLLFQPFAFEPFAFDPSEPGTTKRVHRGGSFLCTDQYCSRYMVGTRGKGEPDTGTNHLGFRCVRGPDGPG